MRGPLLLQLRVPYLCSGTPGRELSALYGLHLLDELSSSNQHQDKMIEIQIVLLPPTKLPFFQNSSCRHGSLTLIAYETYPALAL